jgi:hypothetical protein
MDFPGAIEVARTGHAMERPAVRTGKAATAESTTAAKSAAAAPRVSLGEQSSKGNEQHGEKN